MAFEAKQSLTEFPIFKLGDPVRTPFQKDLDAFLKAYGHTEVFHDGTWGMCFDTGSDDKKDLRDDPLYRVTWKTLEERYNRGER